ncbi:hypothetical protein [Pseudomonas prosekii]|uniref:Uncharacterized protein n=1 Tax=Pseudomonas prosekii TaxID=1148509 RepID=A0A1H1YZ44_9PSED|nr:hypothetical protein [Pseudomonas prosekii]PWE45451.1 hypothetical protein C9I49_10940 [Pseudomonas prosekii]SDT26720.1 hypothetical protein SAMN05216222_3668 [Pseudomonas prosekii]
MSRNLFDVAYASLDDLYEIQDAFKQMDAVFEVLASKYPAGSLANDLAQLGQAVNNDWATKAAQWAECLDDELDGFPVEAQAYIQKSLRREVLRAGSTQ